MNPTFDQALSYVLKNEGGLAQVAGDRGGTTYAGVTKASLTAYYATIGAPRGIDDGDILALAKQPDVVADVYRRSYWSAIQGDKLACGNASVALLDLAVLCGAQRAVMLAQLAVCALVDGKLGPLTIAALGRVDAATLLDRLEDGAVDYFIALCVKDPVQTKFLPGWRARAKRFRELKKSL